MTKTKSLSLTAGIALATAFTFSCSGDDGGGGGVWLTSNIKTYTVTDGVVVGVSGEYNYRYQYISYTDDNNYEVQYTVNSGGVSSSYTNSSSRNGNTARSVTHQTQDNYDITQTTTTVYDEESGLALSWHTTSTGTQNGKPVNTSSETNYTIVPLSTGSSVKTYKQTNRETGAYSEYKVQNGVTLEAKGYTAEGVLSSIATYTNGVLMEQKSYTAKGELSFTTTYTFPDNATIRAKLPTFTLTSATYASGGGVYQTCEVVRDSATELVIRVKHYSNEGAFTSQSETTYVRHH